MKIERDRIITIKHIHYKGHAVESRMMYIYNANSSEV